MSYHKNIIWEIVIQNPDKYWNWHGISEHPNITWKIIEQLSGITSLGTAQWYSISNHPNITWEIIQQNPDNPWQWRAISINPNITWEIIRDNPDKPWEWTTISCNPNITWEIIRDNPDEPWEWNWLSDNTMKLGKERWINKQRLQHIKAFQIQKHWRNCSCNPQFKLAQRCLLRLHGS